MPPASLSGGAASQVILSNMASTSPFGLNG
ncbi:hypothetical protein IL54_0296 [Sphingobium sp. ba1]|nr:hypothetical protein IL54_0296 [Sphingobium sp. ba1]